MITPFQRLLVCSRQGQKHFGTVLVASGPSLYAFNTSDGHFLSKWSHSQNASDNANTGRARSPDEQGPPGKRRKLTPPSTGASGQNSPEIITDNGLNERKKPKIPVPNVPAIINLCSTSDGKHIIAVTGEDKCIRVLTLSEDGILEELSQRAMPKRPNALSLTADEKTILCGDKFGDVYAIPLIEDPDWKAENEPHADMNKSIEQSQTAEEMFKSAANSLTVHSKRNRKTLEAQQKQKVAAAKAQKPVMQFQYQHLLGHVSLLTDVTSIRLETAEGPRDYILSSDRDEHIRVSRGIPQAHIIENYCLGHSQFISKICSLKWRPDILVSGGGDDYLLFWDWVSGTVRQEVDLREPCEAVRTTLRSDTGPTEGLSESGIVVSGIWALQTGDSEGLIIVICEGLPALITYGIDTSGKVRHRETLITGQNVLDVSLDNTNRRMIYSLDNAHKSSSTTELDTERRGPFIGAHSFSLETKSWTDECDGTLPIKLNAWAETYPSSGREIGESGEDTLSQLFYGIGNLRKQSNEEQD